MKISIFCTLMLSLSSFCLQADEFHYKDLLIGERASGLGGAFVAISDDPSGIYYNPAGIAFASENYLSLSANAFTSGSQRFKDVFPGKDYTYKSQNFTPSLFGFTQAIGRGRLGIAVMVPSSELLDQDDSITNDATAADVRTLTRRYFRQDSTYLFGPAYAQEVAPNLSVGISLFGFARMEKLIDNQLVQIDPSGANKYFIQNTYLERTSYGVQPKLGVEWMPAPQWSVGLCISKKINTSGTGKYKNIATKLNGSNPITPNGNFTNDMTATGSVQVVHNVLAPWEISLGVAHFVNKTFLLSAQIDGYSAEPFTDYQVKAVINFSIGAEYFLNDWLAVRGGFYTNGSQTPALNPSLLNQLPHVNMTGSTLSLSLFRSNSSITLGTGYSWGSGQGQAIFNNATIQTVSQNNLTLYLSGSYQL